jgi:hypothetical protein
MLRSMPKVILVVSTDNGNLELSSENLNAQAAQEWIKKIDAAMAAGASTIETDWATARKGNVVAAYLSDR